MWARSQTIDGRLLLGVLLGTAFVVLLVGAPAGTAEWRETARVDGIVVSERTVEGSQMPTFRAIGLVEADLATVLGVIRDVVRHPDWLEDCVESSVLAQQVEGGKAVHYVYHRTNVPWPLADRDVVLRTEVDVVDPGRLIFVRFRTAPTMFPPVSGTVRITRLDGFYRLEALGPLRTSVEYRVDVEPAGSVPGWVQRQVTRSIPLDTVTGLRRQASRVRFESPGMYAAEATGAVSTSAVAGVAAAEVGVPEPRTIATDLAPEAATADTR